MRLIRKLECKDITKNKKLIIKMRKKVFDVENIESKLGMEFVTLYEVLKQGHGYFKLFECKTNPAYDESGDRCSRAEPYFIADKKRPIIVHRSFVLRHDNTHPLFITVKVSYGSGSVDFFLKDFGITWALTEEALL